MQALVIIVLVIGWRSNFAIAARIFGQDSESNPVGAFAETLQLTKNNRHFNFFESFPSSFGQHAPPIPSSAAEAFFQPIKQQFERKSVLDTKLFPQSVCSDKSTLDHFAKMCRKVSDEHGDGSLEMCQQNVNEVKGDSTTTTEKNVFDSTERSHVNLNNGQVSSWCQKMANRFCLVAFEALTETTDFGWVQL